MKMTKTKINLPNFLIVGAAKSGTTSLYYYLKQHPEIYLPKIKECKFFSHMTGDYKGPGDEEDLNKQIIKTLDDYKLLFANTTDEKAIGDISPDYLYYFHESIKNIKSILGNNVKILIILRNPIERAYSKYLHNVREGFETLSFEEALKEENVRKNNNWGWGWYLVESGLYFNQIKTYMDNFSQVQVLFYEDLLKNTLDLMKRIFLFLEIDPNFIPNIEVKFNASGKPKNKFINNMLVRPSFPKTILKGLTKPFLSDDKRRELKESLRAKNTEKISMEEDTRAYLRDVFKEDVLKLQALINKDLSYWLA
ncbi:MAG: sulfotransferase domain-containing protein [Planctomycetes bacterium]|nr:sulfotransferase domain-containing protein [Planctomycetota bacterium]